MIVIPREAEDRTGLSFAEEVVDRPPHTSSVSTSFIEFSFPVGRCLEMSKFSTALQSAVPSCSRVSFSVSLEFSFQPMSFFFTCGTRHRLLVGSGSNSHDFDWRLIMIVYMSSSEHSVNSSRVAVGGTKDH